MWDCPNILGENPNWMVYQFIMFIISFPKNCTRYTQYIMVYSMFRHHFPRRSRLRRSWMTSAKLGSCPQQVAHRPWRICCGSDASEGGKMREGQKLKSRENTRLWVVLNIVKHSKAMKYMKCHEKSQLSVILKISHALFVVQPVAHDQYPLPILAIAPRWAFTSSEATDLWYVGLFENGDYKMTVWIGTMRWNHEISGCFRQTHMMPSHP